MFIDKTRRKTIPLATRAKGSGNPLTWTLPKTGLLAGLFLDIRGTIAGVVGVPHALGKSVIVRNVRLTANNGIDLINISGPGYHYLLRNNLEDYRDATPGADGTAVIVNGAFDISMYLPVAINSRDPLGLIMLQNEQTEVTLSVEFEADATVEAACTVTANVQPFVELFTVPVDPKDWPSLDVVHQIVEQNSVIGGVGDFTYDWPRGNTYAQVVHGLGMAAAGGADGFSNIRLLINGTETISNLSAQALSMEYGRTHGAARRAGVALIDFLGTSGLGNFGSARDLLNSQVVTELQSVITVAVPGTMRTIRRQLIPLAG